MATDDKPSPPNPFDDVRKGLGLLFRAAKTVAQKLPTDPIEKVVLDGAREVGRAVENVTNTVASTIEKQVFGKDKSSKSDTATGDEAHAAPPAKSEASEASERKNDEHSPAAPKPSDDEPKPRVG